VGWGGGRLFNLLANTTPNGGFGILRLCPPSPALAGNASLICRRTNDTIANILSSIETIHVQKMALGLSLVSLDFVR
jgi:hypothetical protein